MQYIICNILYAICNEETDLLNIYSLNKKRKKTFRRLVLCIKIKFTMERLQ